MFAITVAVAAVVGGGGGRAVRWTREVFRGFNVGTQEFKSLVGGVSSREDLADHGDLVAGAIKNARSDTNYRGSFFALY